MPKETLPAKKSKSNALLFSLIALSVAGVGGCVAFAAAAYYFELHTKALDAFKVAKTAPEPKAKGDVNAPEDDAGPRVKKITDQEPPLKEVIDPEQGYKVLFPGTPVVEVFEHERVNYGLETFARKGGRLIYMYDPAKVPGFEIDQLGALLKHTNCKIAKETPIVIHGQKGTEFEAVSLDPNGPRLRGKFGTATVQDEDDIKGGVPGGNQRTRALLTAVMGDDAFIRSPDAERFLNSLVLVPKQEIRGEVTVAGGHRLTVAAGDQGPAAVRAIAISPDDRWLLLGCDDAIKIWDLWYGKEVRTMKGHRDGINAITFSSDGKWVLTASRDRTARLWDFAAGKEIRVFGEHQDSVDTAFFSGDDEWVILGCEHAGKIYARETGKLVHATPKHQDHVRAVALSRDKKLLAVGARFEPGFSVEATLWDIPGLKPVKTFAGEFGRGINSIAITNDNKRVITTSDGRVQVFDLSTAKRERTFAGPGPRCGILAFDGKQILFGGEVNGDLYDVETIKRTRIFDRFAAGPSQFGVPLIRCAALSRDGKRLIAGDDTSAHVWDTATGWPLCRLLSTKRGTWAVFDGAGRVDFQNDPGDAFFWLHEQRQNSSESRKLNEQFRDPGLLAKYYGFDQRPLRVMSK